jgi:hypothetical protein
MIHNDQYVFISSTESERETNPRMSGRILARWGFCQTGKEHDLEDPSVDMSVEEPSTGSVRPKGAPNFRDIGGIRNRNERCVRRAAETRQRAQPLKEFMNAPESMSDLNCLLARRRQAFLASPMPGADIRRCIESHRPAHRSDAHRRTERRP